MKSIELAKDVVYLCEKHQHEYNNTKVQKLIFLILGFALMNNIKPTEKVKDYDGEEIDSVIDELPKAWPYGPVFPKVHKKYSEIRSTNFKDYELSVSNDKVLKEIVEKTVKLWGQVSASKLSGWSHEKGSPWDVVVQQGNASWNTPIPLGIITYYFCSSMQNVLTEYEEREGFFKKICKKLLTSKKT